MAQTSDNISPKTLTAADSTPLHFTLGEHPECSLESLKGSEPALVSIEIKKSYRPSEEVEAELYRVAPRLTVLRTEWQFDFIDKLLVSQRFPKLTELDVVALPLPFDNPRLVPPLFPGLTHLTFKLYDWDDIPEDSSTASHDMGEALLNFLRNCPQLKVAYIKFDHTTFGPGKLVSLPHLRSFTLESDLITKERSMDFGLINRLSILSTCDVAFTITEAFQEIGEPWDKYFLPIGSFCLPDFKTVEIKFELNADQPNMIRTRFSHSEGTSFSLDRLTYEDLFSAQQVERVLAFLTSSKMTRSVETLSFIGCPFSPEEKSPAPNLTGQLSKLGNLKKLVFRECEPFLLLQNPSPYGLWCPSIEHLIVSFQPLSPDRTRDLLSPDLTRDLLSPDLFSDLLWRVGHIASSRKDAGKPLKAVSLYLGPEVKRHFWGGSAPSEWLKKEVKRCVESVDFSYIY